MGFLRSGMASAFPWLTDLHAAGTEMSIHGLKLALGATALFCGLVGHAQATLILVSGISGGNTGTDNVVFNPCDSIVTGPALTVQGCLNTDHAQNVNFTGNEN